MKKILVASLFAVLSYSAQAESVTVTMSCGTQGADFERCQRLTQQWAKKTGNKVAYLSMPLNSNDILSMYRRMFAAKSDGADVIMIDNIWPGMIKDHLLDLTPYSNGQEKKMFPSLVANYSIKGKLLAMPTLIDSGILYYRKDLLEKYNLAVPKTWQELTTMAQTIQDGERKSGKSNFWGYVFQGKAYEGLSCNAIEWIHSFGGGAVIDKAGNITINNPKAAQALDLVASWVGKISPPGVLNYAEEDARGVFQTGQAAFMRNWSYAWAMAQGNDSVIKDKVGMAPMPKGPDGPVTSAQGGWGVAVSKYSKHPVQAADLVMYMTSEPIQKQVAIENANTPTYPELYRDKDVLKANPFMSQLYDVFLNTTARPAAVTGLKYNEVSQTFWNGIHEAMSGKKTGTQAVADIEAKLKYIKRQAW